MTVLFSLSTVVYAFVIGFVVGLATGVGIHWIAYFVQHWRGK